MKKIIIGLGILAVLIGGIFLLSDKSKVSKKKLNYNLAAPRTRWIFRRGRFRKDKCNGASQYASSKNR